MPTLNELVKRSTQPPPIIQKIIKACEAMPMDEFKDSRGIGDHIGHGASTVQQMTADHADLMAPYRVRVTESGRRVMYYGNKKSIAKLRATPGIKHD